MKKKVQFFIDIYIIVVFFENDMIFSIVIKKGLIISIFFIFLKVDNWDQIKVLQFMF